LTYNHPGATAPENVAIRYGVGDTSDKYSYIPLLNISDGDSRAIVVTLDAESGWDPTTAKWMAGIIPSGASVDINSFIIFYNPTTKKP
jgi:hypothetical protein